MSYYRQVTPLSKGYDIYLAWLSPNGGVRQWFFSSTMGSEIESFKNFAIEGLADIRTIPEEDRIIYNVSSRFLNADDFDYVRSLMKSNRVYQVLTNGTQIPVAIAGGSVKKPNKDKSFGLDFDVSLKEGNILHA